MKQMLSFAHARASASVDRRRALQRGWFTSLPRPALQTDLCTKSQTSRTKCPQHDRTIKTQQALPYNLGDATRSPKEAFRLLLTSSTNPSVRLATYYTVTLTRERGVYALTAYKRLEKCLSFLACFTVFFPASDFVSLRRIARVCKRGGSVSVLREDHVIINPFEITTSRHTTRSQLRSKHRVPFIPSESHATTQGHGYTCDPRVGDTRTTRIPTTSKEQVER